MIIDRQNLRAEKHEYSQGFIVPSAPKPFLLTLMFSHSQSQQQD